MHLKDWIYKHRMLVAGMIASVILVAILASCVAGQGLINANGDGNSIVLKEAMNV